MKIFLLTISLLSITFSINAQSKPVNISNGDGWYRIIEGTAARGIGEVKISGALGNNRYTHITMDVSLMRYSQGGVINITNNMFYNTNHIDEIRAGSINNEKYVLDIHLVGVVGTPNLSVETNNPALPILDVAQFNPIPPDGNVIEISGQVLGISSNRWPIYFNDNVGIGTSTPTAGLEVKNDEGIKIQSSQNGGWIGTIKMTDGFTNTTSRDDMMFSTSGGFMFKMDNNGNGISNVQGFNIYDRNDNSTFTIKENNGNVGIGTTNPLKKLEIKGEDGVGIRIFNENANTWDILNSQYGKLDFVRGGTDTFMRIDQVGNVAIGLPNPNSKLHVKGDNLDDLAGSKSILSTIEGSIGGANNSKFQILNKRNSDGTDWFDTSLRLQKVIDNTEQAFIDFGIEGKRADYGLAFGTRDGFSGTQKTRMVIQSDGNVGIGTIKPDAMLTVAGNIHSREVKVTIDAGADFVFEDDYNLMPLETLENYLTTHKHLPEIAPAKEMEQDGIELSKMNIKLLQKIEELTLYLIDQNKKIEKLEEEVSALKNKS